MIIGFMIWTIIISFIVLELSYNFWYSPKAQVNRLIKNMRKTTSQYYKLEKEFGREDSYVQAHKQKLENIYFAINQLLGIKHYFDSENDKEFIEKSRETAEIWRNPKK